MDKSPFETSLEDSQAGAGASREKPLRGRISHVYSIPWTWHLAALGDKTFGIAAQEVYTTQSGDGEGHALEKLFVCKGVTMYAWLLLAMVCGDPGGERAGQNEVEPLAPHEIRLAIREALRDEATAEDFQARAAPLRRLCALYADLWLSETLAEAQRENLKPKLRSRLKRSLADLTREFGEPVNDAGTASPGDVVGGASGGAAVADHAAELIELITTTLAPETWEQNGGEGSIYYFNNFRVLVVRQTAEIHHRPAR